jgi:hypothetical protein
MFKKLATKDNFWNLMFWVGMVFGAFISTQLMSIADFLGLPMLIGTIICVPKLVNKYNKVTLIDENILLNSQGEKLNSKYPKKFAMIFLINIPIAINLLFATKDIQLLNDSPAAYIGIILFLPTLYFILINCPIAILFNAHAWTKEVTGWEIDPNAPPVKHNFSDSHNIHKPSPLQEFARTNTITDPRYMGSGSNIFNLDRR